MTVSLTRSETFFVDTRRSGGVRNEPISYRLYNCDRRHSTHGYRPPREFENRHQAGRQAAA